MGPRWAKAAPDVATATAIARSVNLFIEFLSISRCRSAGDTPAISRCHYPWRGVFGNRIKVANCRSSNRFSKRSDVLRSKPPFVAIPFCRCLDPLARLYAGAPECGGDAGAEAHNPVGVGHIADAVER